MQNEKQSLTDYEIGLTEWEVSRYEMLVLIEVKRQIWHIEHHATASVDRLAPWMGAVVDLIDKGYLEKSPPNGPIEFGKGHGVALTQKGLDEVNKAW